jgi:hypothetical protein
MVMVELTDFGIGIVPNRPMGCGSTNCDCNCFCECGSGGFTQSYGDAQSVAGPGGVEFNMFQGVFVDKHQD